METATTMGMISRRPITPAIEKMGPAHQPALSFGSHLESVASARVGEDVLGLTNRPADVTIATSLRSATLVKRLGFSGPRILFMQVSGRWSPSSVLPFRRPALVVGHPGHELKVFGWMSEYTPRVFVITDGSGRSGFSRTPSTASLVARTGAVPGEVFGLISDAEIYRAILQRDSAVFLGMVDRIAASFVTNHIDSVAGDASEGFNPTHDLCRVVIEAALRKAERATRKTIVNLEFCLTEWEQNCPSRPHDGRCLHWRLDDGLLAAKLEAARGYPELRDEVERALASRGKEYFRIECLRPAQAPELSLQEPGKPLYEIWGEQRVAGGAYSSVIRYQEHILPITKTILDYAGDKAQAPSFSKLCAS
jgi:hypothetical protein